MNYNTIKLNRRRVKRWIYVAVVMQCCVLFAYLGIYHAASSRTSLVDSLSRFTTGGRKRRASDAVTRIFSPAEETDWSGNGTHGKVEHLDNRISRKSRDKNSFFSTARDDFQKQFTKTQKDVTYLTDTNLISEMSMNEHLDGVFAPSDNLDELETIETATSYTTSSNMSSNAVKQVKEELTNSNLHELGTFYENYLNDSFKFVGNINETLGLNIAPDFHLENNSLTPEFYSLGNVSCLLWGTEDVNNVTGCNCKPQWFGNHCSIPDIVYLTGGVSRYVENFKLRSQPRRIISAIAFNIEFELLEARLHEHHDLVDVFILLESSFTHFGEPKPLRLLDRMLQGYLKEFHSKICYLLLPHFPVSARENGWIMDQYHRTFISRESMKHLIGTRPDDIYMYTDADEIPSRESLVFIKLHDGIPEPFGLSLRWSVFGFFWKQHDPTRIMVGSTVAMLRYVFQNDVYLLRTNTYQSREAELRRYLQSGERTVFDWYIADTGGFAGWHCSWCLTPAGIRIKLASAINADFPRWGNYPEKLDVNYIRKLIKTGTWFDDKSSFGSLVNNDTDIYLAPKYIIRRFKKYKHLLDVNKAG